ncbi:unnamed protein product [Arctogadus glacialis]
MSEVKQVLLCRTRKKPSASFMRFIDATCGRFVLVRRSLFVSFGSSDARGSPLSGSPCGGGPPGGALPVQSGNRGDGGPRRVSGLRVKSPRGPKGEAAGADIEDEACQPACRKTLPLAFPETRE